MRCAALEGCWEEIGRMLWRLGRNRLAQWRMKGCVTMRRASVGHRILPLRAPIEDLHCQLRVFKILKGASYAGKPA